MIGDKKSRYTFEDPGFTELLLTENRWLLWMLHLKYFNCHIDQGFLTGITQTGD